MRLTILCLTLVLHGYSGFAQDTVKKSLIRVYDVGFFMSFTEPNQNTLSGLDYQKILPENNLLRTYKANSGQNSSGEVSDVGGWATFTFWNKKKQRYHDRVQLRVGLFYNKQTFNLDENGVYRSACDTLISSSSPKVYYIDTTKQYYYSIRRQEDAIGIFIQNTFHTRQNKYISFYTGYGFRYGFTLNHLLDVSLNYSESFTDQNGKDYYGTYESSNRYDVHEKSTVRASNALAVYIPVGANLRIVRPLARTISRFSFNPEVAVGYRMQKFANYGNSNEFFFYVKFGACFNLNRIKL
jgi:hypothetical protein